MITTLSSAASAASESVEGPVRRALPAEIVIIFHIAEIERGEEFCKHTICGAFPLLLLLYRTFSGCSLIGDTAHLTSPILILLIPLRSNVVQKYMKNK